MLSDVYSYNITNFLGLQIINYVSFSVYFQDFHYFQIHFCSLTFLSHVLPLSDILLSIAKLYLIFVLHYMLYPEVFCMTLSY